MLRQQVKDSFSSCENNVCVRSTINQCSKKNRMTLIRNILFRRLIFFDLRSFAIETNVFLIEDTCVIETDRISCLSSRTSLSHITYWERSKQLSWTSLDRNFDKDNDPNRRWRFSWWSDRICRWFRICFDRRRFPDWRRERRRPSTWRRKFEGKRDIERTAYHITRSRSDKRSNRQARTTSWPCFSVIVRVLRTVEPCRWLIWTEKSKTRKRETKRGW